MARKVTADDIKQMNSLYYKLKSFAAVAREIGFSSSTVSKYVDKTWQPIASDTIQRFAITDITPVNVELFQGLDNYGDLCHFSDIDREEMKKFWEELEV